MPSENLAPDPYLDCYADELYQEWKRYNIDLANMVIGLQSLLSVILEIETLSKQIQLLTVHKHSRHWHPDKHKVDDIGPTINPRFYPKEEPPSSKFPIEKDYKEDQDGNGQRCGKDFLYTDGPPIIKEMRYDMYYKIPDNVQWESFDDHNIKLENDQHIVADSGLKQTNVGGIVDKSNKKINQDLIKERFEVLSKGTKWVKVLNNAGYEDKILLSKVTGLKEGCFYEAMVKKKWHKSGYGIDVEYEEIQDLKKVNGFCIICGKEIEFDPSTPLCKPCYFKNKKYRGYIFGKKCHQCGKEKFGILDSKPQCKDCYYEK